MWQWGSTSSDKFATKKRELAVTCTVYKTRHRCLAGWPLIRGPNQVVVGAAFLYPPLPTYIQLLTERCRARVRRAHEGPYGQRCDANGIL
jgi:hypothetical protein